MAENNPIASKLIFGLIIFVIVIVVMLTRSKDSDVNAQLDAENMQSTSVLPASENTDVKFVLGADGDTNNDTLRTLTAQMKSMQEEMSSDTQSEIELINQNIELKKEVELANEVTTKITTQFDTFITKISELELNLENLSQKKGTSNTNPSNTFSGANEYPINLSNTAPNKANSNRNTNTSGIPQLATPNANPTRQSTQHNIQTNEDIVWVNPIDSEQTVNEDGTFSMTFPELSISTLKSTALYQTVADTDYGDSVGMNNKKEGTAYITINRGATSINAVALTALIGRIPTAGQIVDPFRFKALINIDTLASNGIVIDGLSGAVVGGRVSGDYTLKCVKADIDYITFTFQDGTISTFPESEGENSQESLGYISDNAGIPCITGQYLSNGGSYITQQLALSTLAAGGKAYSDSQTTTQVSGETANSSVTGNSTKFALGEMTNAGLSTVGDWFTDRQQGAFDAIYAPPATEITLHFEKQITINYNENGRKTNHDYTLQQNHSSFDFSGLN